jgi:hypothetical protein
MTTRREAKTHEDGSGGAACRLDLHGYSRAEAEVVADEVVRRAWEAGCGSVTLIHGAPDVPTREQAEAGGRGGIKFDLRDRLAGGAWSAFAAPADAFNHVLGAGVLTVKLKDNPAASPTRLQSRRLTQPTAVRQGKARRAWERAAGEVGAEHPVLIFAAAQWPQAVGRCRRALTEERLLADRLAHKRRHNPDYEVSKPYRRLKRKWEKAGARAASALAAVEAIVAGAAVGSEPQEPMIPRPAIMPPRPADPHHGPVDHTPNFQGDHL